MIVVLDQVKDFGNVGTIVRTASAFGVRTFASTTEEADFFYKKTIEASRGTVFDADLQRFPSGEEAIQRLKAQGYQIVVTTPHASSLQSFAVIESKPVALVFGNETEGVSDALLQAADIKVLIPMSGPWNRSTWESLPVSASMKSKLNGF